MTSPTSVPHDLPKKNWLGVYNIVQWEGFWHMEPLLEPIMAAKTHFKAFDDDIIIAAPAKTGCTWLKALIPSIMNRSTTGVVEDDDDPLINHHPNELVPFIDFVLSKDNPNIDPPSGSTPRLYGTHIPYSQLSESIQNSSCKIVYIARDPKDTVVSLWHFLNTRRAPEEGPLPFEELFENFCDGVHPFGPFLDHIVGFWNESLKRPEKILFLKFEDMKADSKGEVKKLASFLGRPFVDEEEVDKILWRCSIERLKELDVNKNGKNPRTGLLNSAFFRKGTVGDWKNVLSTEMKEKIEKIKQEKLEGTGLTL